MTIHPFEPTRATPPPPKPWCRWCGDFHEGRTSQAPPRSDLNKEARREFNRRFKRVKPAQPSAGPEQGPCSACGDGDTEQQFHKHDVAPEQEEQ